MMKNVINWFEIYTSDFNRAKQFYKDVFKCDLIDIPMNSDRHSQMQYALFRKNENKFDLNGALVKIDEAKPGIGGTLVYFATEEITAELGRVETAGGKIIRPKLDLGEFGFIALIQDTETNLIGLRSEK
ncbi:glyoxalase [Niastella koreensis]|nr:glyoxalase [Niastella koreensis]